MKLTFWDTKLEAKLIKFLIKEHCVLKNLFILTLMKLTPLRRRILIVMMQVSTKKKKTSLMKGLLLN